MLLKYWVPLKLKQWGDSKGETEAEGETDAGSTGIEAEGDSEAGSTGTEAEEDGEAAPTETETEGVISTGFTEPKAEATTDEETASGGWKLTIVC